MTLTLILGLITFINAQGITNTLGGTTANDKFIIENSDSEAGLVVTGEGRVGIGIVAPHSSLHVISTSMSGFDNTAKFEALGIGSNVSHIHYGTKGDWYIRSATSDGKVVMQDSGGNVGIGTTNPLSKLSVGGEGNIDATIYGETSGTDGIGVYGIALNTVGNHNYGGYFEAAGYSGRGVSGIASKIDATTNWGGFFEANAIYGVGVWSAAYGTTGKGVVAYGKAYDYDATGPGVDYGATSSIRWKNNIVEIDKPLEKLSELRGVYFNWDEEHGGRHDVGCIAEEVGKVLPEIVVYEENGIDANGMDYSKLTPLLIEALKALEKRVEELENR